MITSQSQIWNLIKSKLPKDKKTDLQIIYTLVEDNISLSEEDFDPESPSSGLPKWKRNVRNVLQSRKEIGDIVWFNAGTYMLPSAKDLVNIEFQHRMSLWNKLKREWNSKDIPPSNLRDMRIYGGAQGVWLDKSRTKLITDGDEGITVSVLHLGSAYADDLKKDRIFYHYPKTNRPPNRDLSEINATKRTALLSIPIFVVINSENKTKSRDVKLGWVVNWDDDELLFEIVFSDESPSEQVTQDDWAVLEDEVDKPIKYPEGSTRRISVNVYERSAQARSDCLAYFGTTCKVCGFNFGDVFGEFGKGFIHVHHKKPLSEINDDYQVDPIGDLVPVCPNCHAMVHKRKPAFSIEDIRNLIQEYDLSAPHDNTRGPNNSPEFDWKCFLKGASAEFILNDLMDYVKDELNLEHLIPPIPKESRELRKQEWRKFRRLNDFYSLLPFVKQECSLQNIKDLFGMFDDDAVLDGTKKYSKSYDSFESDGSIEVVYRIYDPEDWQAGFSFFNDMLYHVTITNLLVRHY